MAQLAQINKEIAAKVREFRDNVVAGRVSADVLQKHKIPATYLDVCRDPSHPSCQKLHSRLFEYLMDKVGYYRNIMDEKALVEISSQLDELLNNPIEDEKQKELYMPRFILGVNKALDRIESINKAQEVDFAGKDKVGNVKFEKIERGFQLSYIKAPRVSIVFEDYSTPTSMIRIDDEDYEIPAGGGHLSSHKVTFTQPDEVVIGFDKLHHSCLKDDQHYYFRYITEVNTNEELRRVFETGYYDVDGSDTFAIDTQVDGKQLLLYFYRHNGKRYLIIEYEEELTAKAMSELAFSTLVAFGMITSDIHLNEYWLVAYSTPEKRHEEGVYYHSLVPSIHCDYQIFTTNVFPVLVHVAKKIDPVRGEHRACEIISKLKLSNALPEFPCEVFGRLVENFRKYEDLQRGIFIILMGSKLHLEIQAATYCVAMEAIANVAPKIIGDDILVIVKDKPRWKAIRKEFAGHNSRLLEEGKLNAEEYDGMDRKINSMNNNFNNMILKSLLVHYHYPLSPFDDLTLKLRNVLLHGSIEIDKFAGRKPEDYLFELSMNLHKLCCSIALLMTGYKGYIVNNRKLYDFPNSYKAFIKIGQ